MDFSPSWEESICQCHEYNICAASGQHIGYQWQIPRLKSQQWGTNQKLHESNICFNFWCESGSSCRFGSDLEAAERIGFLTFSSKEVKQAVIFGHGFIHPCLHFLHLTERSNVCSWYTASVFFRKIISLCQELSRLLASQTILQSIKAIEKEREVWTSFSKPIFSYQD